MNCECDKFQPVDSVQPVIEGTPRWMGLAVVALAVLSLVGTGMAWNANSHAHDAAQALATQTTQSKTFQQSQEQLTQRLAQAEQTNAQMQGELNLVSDKLKLTQGQVQIARNQVKKERADYTKKLSDVESTLATKASADDVKAIRTDVNGVKTDLDATAKAATNYRVPKSKSERTRGPLRGPFFYSRHFRINGSGSNAASPNCAGTCAARNGRPRRPRADRQAHCRLQREECKFPHRCPGNNVSRTPDAAAPRPTSFARAEASQDSDASENCRDHAPSNPPSPCRPL